MTSLALAWVLVTLIRNGKDTDVPVGAFLMTEILDVAIFGAAAAVLALFWRRKSG